SVRLPSMTTFQLPEDRDSPTLRVELGLSAEATGGAGAGAMSGGGLSTRVGAVPRTRARRSTYIPVDPSAQRRPPRISARLKVDPAKNHAQPVPRTPDATIGGRDDDRREAADAPRARLDGRAAGPGERLL